MKKLILICLCFLPALLLAKPYKISICPNGMAASETDTAAYLAYPETWANAAKASDLYMCYDANLVEKPWHGHKKVDIQLLVDELKKFDLKIGLEFSLFGVKTATRSVGQQAADTVIALIDKIHDAGGKLYSLHLDGPEYRMLKGLAHDPNNALELDAFTDELLIFFKTVHEKYPEVNIGLIACPHGWNYDENHRGFNANYSKKSGLYLRDVHNAMYKKLSEGGEKIAFMSIDHPYPYYIRYKSHGEELPVDPKATYLLLQDWCNERNIDLMATIISEPKYHGDVSTFDEEKKKECDIQFQEDCLNYIEILHKDGIKPQWFQIQSWYKVPCEYGPETKDYTFFNNANKYIKRIGELFDK